MVNYKVRTFCEPEDNDSVGAEVRIYNGEGDNIDTILITTESRYEELVSRLDSMDADYLDINELKEIMQNAQDNDITINATYLDGLTSNQYAKAEHNELHTAYFAPVDHAIETNRYGLGTGSKYGHVKLIDNLNSAMFLSGEALSAYQGKVLNDAIETLKAGVAKWTPQNVGNGVLYVNSFLRLCAFHYFRENFNVTTANSYIKLNNTSIPEEFRPLRSITRPLARDSGHNGIFEVRADTGEFFVKVPKTGKITIVSNILWMY